MKQPSLFPVAMKIVSQTIAQDLVSVQPMNGPSGMSKEYKEEKLEQHPDYKPGSGGQLFYMDYTYNSPTHKKTRRSKKKKKNGSI